MKFLKRLALILMLLSAFTVSGIGCGGGGDEDTGQKVGETMDNAGDKAGNAMDEAGDKAGNAMDKAGDKAEDATH